jgi:PilZ domain-containing protein
LQGIWLSLALAAILVFTWLLLRSGASNLPLHVETRIPLEVPVHLRLGESELEVMSADISKGGMRLKLDHPASVGQPMELEFALPGQRPYLIYAVVRWLGKGQAGVLFDRANEQISFIERWIESQYPGSTEQ